MTLIPKCKTVRANLAIAAIFLLVIAMLPVQRSEAASIDIDIDIIFPSILILFCYDEIDVSITSAVLGNLVIGSPGPDITSNLGVDPASPTIATQVAGALTADIGLTDALAPLTIASIAAVPLNLNDICRVRAVQANGTLGVTVSASLLETVLLGGASGSIGINAGPLVDVDSAGFAASVTFLPGGLGVAHDIDVQLSLDFTNADEAATYSSTIADNFRVTAVLL